MSWISIKDNLPDSGKAVLTHINNLGNSIFIISRRDGNSFINAYTGGLILHNVDYWMEIPTVPNCESENLWKDPNKWVEEFVNKNNEMLKRLADKMIQEEVIDMPDYLKTRYIPVNKWNDYHIWPPIGGLRHLIFNKDKNGFVKVVKKVGKSVLIDEAAFFAWVDSQ